MSEQRYTNELSKSWMRQGFCPECGSMPEEHVIGNEWWATANCDLRVDGVKARIAQFNKDEKEGV